MSIDYYNRNAEQFIQDTVNVDVSDLYARFLKHIVPGGSILDAGCGSGRDALAFCKAGYVVTAFDASVEMVRRSAQYIGLPVLQLTFDEVAWDSAFDGAWANASLVHVPRPMLPLAVAKLVHSLRPEGVLFMSFKYGNHDREEQGRHFTDLTESSLDELLTRAGLMVLDIWASADVRPNRSYERWVSGIGQRQRC